jgi:hypothetical protein
VLAGFERLQRQLAVKRGGTAITTASTRGSAIADA